MAERVTKKIEYLLKNSCLPGPRGNLELLHSFSKSATADEVRECLTYNRDDLHNSPEEFVMMCGVVGFCILNRNDIAGLFQKIRSFASHGSWRVRESVAIGIQEIAENRMDEIILNLKLWMEGNELEKRAIVAALCEPKLLKEKSKVIEVLDILHSITCGFESINGKLTDQQNSLRKALGYGWSVAIAFLPEEGKRAFERLIKNENRHVRWILKENLKKKRIIAMDRFWVGRMLSSLD